MILARRKLVIAESGTGRPPTLPGLVSLFVVVKLAVRFAKLSTGWFFVDQFNGSFAMSIIGFQYLVAQRDQITISLRQGVQRLQAFLKSVHKTYPSRYVDSVKPSERSPILLPGRPRELQDKVCDSLSALCRSLPVLISEQAQKMNAINIRADSLSVRTSVKNKTELLTDLNWKRPKTKLVYRLSFVRFLRCRVFGADILTLSTGQLGHLAQFVYQLNN